MYTYGSNDPVNFIDPSGYLSFGAKIGLSIGIAAAAAAVIILAVVYTGPAAPYIVGATAGASSQMISNIWNDNDLMDNVAGAIVGGALVATGQYTLAAAANSTINQVENAIKNQQINLTQWGTETVLYYGLNKIPFSSEFGKKGIGLMGSGLLDIVFSSFGFSGSDFANENIIPDIVISWGEEGGFYINDDQILAFD